MLWLGENGQLTRLAKTTSEPDGRFEFGDIPMPSGAVELVVSAAGDDPRSAAGTRIDRASLPQPGLHIESQDGGIALYFNPALGGGYLEVSAAHSGRTWTKAAEDGEPIWIEAALLDEDLYVVHRLPDGRSSQAVIAYQAPRRQATKQTTR